jgi:aspartyl aminopeptidase
VKRSGLTADVRVTRKTTSDPSQTARTHTIVHAGIVIKCNANQRYATTSVSAFLFRSLAAEAGVPVQNFVVRQVRARAREGGAGDSTVDGRGVWLARPR